MALDHLVAGLLEFATNEQGSKSVTKALKEGGKETLDRFVKRMAESTKGYSGTSCSHKRALTHQFHSGRRAIIVDLALSATGSQLIGTVLPTVSSHPALGIRSNRNFLRWTRTSAHFCTSRSVGISSLYVVARRVRRSFGYCE
jgi:hypothetical protein